MAAAGGLEEGFDVYVNDSCSRLHYDYAHDLERFVNSFASWQPADSTARKFNGAAIERFLSKVEKEEGFIAEVIGFNEFPYTHGRTLVGSNREIEREYWFEVDTEDARISGQDGLVILHVHFAGKWHEVWSRRDRSTITQINIRHTAQHEEDAFWKKCVDLDKWREQYGERVRSFPGGWKWKERPEVSPALHKLLSIAEKCTRFVRGKSAPTENVPTGKRRALIIANSNYDDTRSFGNLPNAIKDGQQLNDILRRMKWDVAFKVELGLTRMRNEVYNFLEQERDAEVCMFAFIGHGIEVNGSHYLVAQDARLQRSHTNAYHFESEVQNSCIRMDFVQECFGNRRHGTHPTLFVLDCCRSCDYQTPSSQSVSDGFLPSASISKPPAPKPILRNSCVIKSTSAGHVAEDGDPGMGGPFMSAFVKEMEAGGDVVDIVRRTQTAMETAGADQQTVLEQSSGMSCHFPPLSILACGQSATISSSMAAAPASVQFPPSAFQPPSLPGSNTPMEGLVAATATSGDARHGIQHTLDTPPVSPFPFVFVAGSMNSGLARHARSVAEGWEAYGVEHGPVVTLQGKWYGQGGCGSQISLWKPSILHIDARADPESSSMKFKDGAVPYEKLHSILKYISEDGVRAQLLVLMVSHSADGGHGQSLSRFADRILAVRGEASFASRDHLETVYQQLRRGKTLMQAFAYLDFTTHEHNLVLLPSQVQDAELVRFTKCPKERDALDNMCQRLQGVSLSDSFYSEADTASVSEPESDEEGPVSTRKAAFLYNTSGAHSYAQDVQQLFGGLVHGEGGQQPRLSMCGLLLCFAVGYPEHSGFERGAHPECWEEWLDRYKQAAMTGQVIEAEMLDSFEEASSRSGAGPGTKRHSRCIETIDALVKKAIEMDWDMLMEEWKTSVLQDWFTNDESSEAFLARADRHLTGLVFDGRPEDGICGVRVLQALEMSSYGAFMIMNSLAVDVLLVLLDLEFRAARASAEDGVSRPVSGFVTVVCSDRRVFSFRDGKLTKAHARSVIVSGLRCLAERKDEDLGPMWQLPTYELAFAECVLASSSKMSARSMPDTDMEGQDALDDMVEKMRKGFLSEEAMRAKKSVAMHHSSSMKEGLTSAPESLPSQHPKATSKDNVEKTSQSPELGKVLDVITKLKDTAQRLVQVDIASPSVASAASTVSPEAPQHSERLAWLREVVTTLPESEVEVHEDDHVGTGGQAVIERGLYGGREVAIKVYTMRKQEEGKEERAMTEALLLHKMSSTPEGSQHVVHCYGVRIDEERRTRHVQLVLELAVHGSLDTILYNASIPRFWRSDDSEWNLERQGYIESRQVGWLSGVAAAICFLHDDLQLVHCDIKAGNVLLFDDGRIPKLADFGSCLLNSGQRWQGSVTVATQHGVGFTHRYQAPEREDDGADVLPAADIWSFALLTFEVLFATKAWGDIADSQTQRLRQAKLQLLRTADLAPAELTVRDPRQALPGLVALMERCWARSPADRPTMAAIVRDIQLVVAAEPNETPHLVVGREEVLSDDSQGAVRAFISPGCGVIFPENCEHSLFALTVKFSTPTKEMMEAAAQHRNVLADGSESSILLVGPALDYQPSGTRFTSPVRMRLPVWVDFLHQLQSENVVFGLGVFTWDEQEGVWRENPGGCQMLESVPEAEAEASTFCIKAVGAIIKRFKFCGPYTSLWRTPVKFLAVAPVLDDVRPGEEFIFHVFVLEADKPQPDDLVRELKKGGLQEVGNLGLNEAYVVLPTKASVKVFAGTSITGTDPPLTKVPYNGQCFLQFPSDGKQNITGSVVAEFESEVDPQTPLRLLFNIKGQPAGDQQKGQGRTGALPESCTMDRPRAAAREKQPIAPGQVEPCVVQLMCQWNERKPRIYAFFSACKDDNLQLQEEAKKQTKTVHATVGMAYEFSSFPLSTFDDFHEQMIHASSRRTEIVHFSGHGGDKGGLRFVSDAADTSKEESVHTIADVFQFESKREGGSVECVVLNACDTEQLGRAIVERGVPYVLCWHGKVPDPAATKFATWFYKTLMSQAGKEGSKMNAYEVAYKQALIQVDRWRSEMGMSTSRGRTAVEPNSKPAHLDWDLVFIQASDAESRDTGRGLESPDGVGWCTSEDGRDWPNRSPTNRKGEAELQAFEALGVETVFPMNVAPPCRIRDAVKKYWSGALKAEHLEKYGLEETGYEDTDPSRRGKGLKHLRLTVPLLRAWFQPDKLGSRPINGYADVFAEDGALLHLARNAKPGARRKARFSLGESLQLRERNLMGPSESAGTDGHYHIAVAIRNCYQRLGELETDSLVYRS